MLAVKYANGMNNFDNLCDKIDMGETVVVSCETLCSKTKNIYMINEAEYNALQKAKRNAEYLAMLDESEKQLQKGETITFTLEELKEMADFTFTEKLGSIIFIGRRKTERR